MRKKLLPTLALLAAALTGPALAAEYQLLLIEPEAELARRTDTGPAGQAHWAACERFGRELAAAGVLRGGAALQGGRVEVRALAIVPGMAR
jgi:hypothetical protein